MPQTRPAHAMTGHIRYVPDRAALANALAGLGMVIPSPVLVLVGGASNLPTRVQEILPPLFAQLMPVLEQAGITVIDGGTDFGVMALMGTAHRQAGAGFPLLGVAARGTVRLPPPAPDLPTVPERGVALDPAHPSILLVPGQEWGDESPWIMASAAAITRQQAPVLVLVIAGGAITLQDVQHARAAGYPLCVLAGSGGTADRIADTTGASGDGKAAGLHVIPLDSAQQQLPPLLQRVLGR